MSSVARSSVFGARARAREREREFATDAARCIAHFRHVVGERAFGDTDQRSERLERRRRGAAAGLGPPLGDGGFELGRVLAALVANARDALLGALSRLCRHGFHHDLCGYARG